MVNLQTVRAASTIVVIEAVALSEEYSIEPTDAAKGSLAGS